MGTDYTREVTIEEAGKIIDDTYDKDMGGLVADARTGEIIWRLNPDTEEILIIEQMIGGG
jgi:hypothetical protein